MDPRRSHHKNVTAARGPAVLSIGIISKQPGLTMLDPSHHRILVTLPDLGKQFVRAGCLGVVGHYQGMRVIFLIKMYRDHTLLCPQSFINPALALHYE